MNTCRGTLLCPPPLNQARSRPPPGDLGRSSPPQLLSAGEGGAVQARACRRRPARAPTGRAAAAGPRCARGGRSLSVASSGGVAAAAVATAGEVLRRRRSMWRRPPPTRLHRRGRPSRRRRARRGTGRSRAAAGICALEERRRERARRPPTRPLAGRPRRSASTSARARATDRYGVKRASDATTAVSTDVRERRRQHGSLIRRMRFSAASSACVCTPRTTARAAACASCPSASRAPPPRAPAARARERRARRLGLECARALAFEARSRRRGRRVVQLPHLARATAGGGKVEHRQQRWPAAASYTTPQSPRTSAARQRAIAMAVGICALEERRRERARRSPTWPPAARPRRSASTSARARAARRGPPAGRSDG